MASTYVPFSASVFLLLLFEVVPAVTMLYFLTPKIPKFLYGEKR